MVLSALQPEKAPPPMLVTELGILMEVKELQPWKAWLPMLVTELGMLMEVKALQPEKASSLMLVTEFGILMEVKELQLAYLQPIITQYFIDNKSEIWLLFLIAHSKR